MEKQNNFQWQSFFELIVVLVTILGSTVPLYIHTDNKTTAILEAIRQDMRDFHGKLERQDADYKAHMMHLHKDK